MGDTISADLIVKAVVNGFDKIEGALKGSAAASEDLQAAQNRLAQAIFNAESAALRLSEAERELAQNADPEMQRELEGAVLDARVEMDDASQKAADLATEYREMGASANEAGEANEQAAFSFTELNSAIGVARQGIQLAGQAYNAAVAPVLELADAQRELALAGQISVEEAGKIIQIGDDLQISTDTLKRAFKAMVQDGIQPSLESFEQVAAKYQAATDPTEKLQIAQDALGKSYQDLLPLLEKTPAELQAMAQSAQNAGIIMSGAAVKGARDFELALDDLQDQALGLKVALFNQAVPAMTGFLEKTNDAMRLTRLSSQAVKEGNISWLEQQVIAGKVELGMMSMGEAISYVNDKLGNSQTAASGWAAAWNASGGVIRGVSQEVINSTREQADADTKLADAQKLLAASMNGNLGPAFADTSAKQSDAATQLAKVQKELDGLMKTQGKTITVTKDATTSQAEMNVALDKQVIAANNLAAAQKKRDENTDPDKTFQLNAAVNAATLGVEHANAAVGKFTEGLGSSSTATVDNSKKIKELTDKKTELQASIDAAAAAERKLTNEFLFNQATASLDAGAQLDLAKNLGLIDPTSYNAAKAMMELNKQYKDGKIELPEYIAKTKQIASDIETYGVAVGEISPKAQVASDAMRFVNQTIAATPDKTVVFDTSNIPGPAQVASDAIDRVVASMSKAESKHVSFITDLIENHIINYSQTGAAGAQGTAGYIGQHEDGRATGGPVSAGMAYHWNEPGAGPEILVPAGNGYVLNQQQAQQALAMAAGMARGGNGAAGGITVNNYMTVANELDIEALAYRLVRVIQARSR